jgi:hypothetical protein
MDSENGFPNAWPAVDQYERIRMRPASLPFSFAGNLPQLLLAAI